MNENQKPTVSALLTTTGKLIMLFLLLALIVACLWVIL